METTILNDLNFIIIIALILGLAAETLFFNKTNKNNEYDN